VSIIRAFPPLPLARTIESTPSLITGVILLENLLGTSRRFVNKDFFVHFVKYTVIEKTRQGNTAGLNENLGLDRALTLYVHFLTNSLNSNLSLM
jgi:hypothetical protein